MKRSRVNVAVSARASAVERLIWWALATAIVISALITSGGEDVYRFPQFLAVEASGIILFALCAIQTLLQPGRGVFERLTAHRLTVIIVIAAVAWTALTTATSTQRAVSMTTLVWVSTCAAFFLAALAVVERRTIGAAAIPLIPAVANAIVAILQRLQIWSPFLFPETLPLRLRVAGFAGNPNDLGGYLLFPILAAVVLAIIHSGRLRVLYAVVAAIIGAGLVATATITSLVALIAALAVLTVNLSRRAAVWLAIGAVVAGLATMAIDRELASRMTAIVTNLRSGDVQAGTSLRLQSFSAAWLMIQDHPLTGVGPGCFGFSYLPYSVLSFGDHPEFVESPGNFRDVHNDHLQFLATTGIPGYALFLVALWQVARRSFRAEGEDARRRFVKIFAFPHVVGVAVLALGHFPFELAATTCVILYYAAVVLAWSRVS